MIVPRQLSALLVLVAGATAVAGCQSTQSKSEEIAANLGPVKKQKGLVIKEESKDVEVIDTTLLSDPNGTAVVVEVENKSDQTLVDVPVLINVLDQKGKEVFSNDTPGLEPALTSIPKIEPNEKLAWVNDQVLPIGEPDEVEVEVGATDATLEGELPDIEVDEPKLENDQVSGVNATGLATNNDKEQLSRLVLFGIARDGDEVVAAGRAVIEKLNPGRGRAYHVYFIGDPEGAELSLASFPIQEEETDSNG